METTPALALSQQKIEYKLPRASDRYFASRLITQLQKELSQKKRHLAGIVTKWMVLFDYVKVQEEELLLQENPISDEKEFFAANVTVLRGLGRHILRQLKQQDELDLKNLLGFEYADLDACIEELDDMDRAERSDMTEEMKKDISAAVFNM